MRFWIDCGSIVGGSKPEKSIKTIVFSMVFADFQKIGVIKKIAQKPRFWLRFRMPKRWKIKRKWCWKSYFVSLVSFCVFFFRFCVILAKFWEALGAPKTKKKLKKSRSGRYFNAFGFEGRLWKGSGAILMRFWHDFRRISKIWNGFWKDFFGRILARFLEGFGGTSNDEEPSF